MAQADVYTIKHSPIPCNLVLIGFMGTGKSTVSDSSSRWIRSSRRGKA